MEQQLTIGEQIRVARQQRKLSQSEVAYKCNLNIRTIQRIENNEVTPRFYTLRIINEILDTNILSDETNKKEDQQVIEIRRIFKKRKQIRLITFIVVILLLASTLLLLISGIPKRFWAPFIYFFFLADFIVIGLTWRCPGCNSLLGDVFKQKYCSNCGLNFYEDKK
jgi:transcriptional regulator with XRE-family HTH domain